MELNKIYRYYNIPRTQAYAQLKEKFTEAFTGFDGVSFETVEATDETTEKYNIYLDSDKSTWLTIYTENSNPRISVNFKDGTTTVLNQDGYDNRGYCQFNIVRTVNGVVFSKIRISDNVNEMLNDNYYTSFFAIGSPNVFVYTLGSLNTDTSSRQDYWYSNLHETPEVFSCYSSIYGGIVPRTKLVNASSMTQPIDCEHLYRLNFSDGNVGKIKVGEKYVILGMRYALEYDPNDDGKEV